MAWKKSPEELTTFLDESLSNVNCTKRKMFGFPAYFINGNMFSGTFEENLFLRLSREDQDNITKHNTGVKPFEPMKGRAMKEYVVLPKSIYNNKKEFSLWMDRSIHYVSSLPIKKRKKK